MAAFGEVITIVRDIAATTGACIASFVAIKGLRTWQRQLKGNSEYDLARKLLVSAYKLRDAIEGFRAPFIHPMETANALKETGNSLGNCPSIPTCVLADEPCVQAESVRTQCGFPTFPPP